MKILQTAVIGLGRAGWQMHIPQIVKNLKYQLVAVVDPLQERLTEAYSVYGVNGYANTAEMYKHVKPDVVVIVSPTHFHEVQTIEAFEHGADVLCDKPMAPTLAEADRMIAAMKKNKRKLMIYQPHRTYADTIALKDILEKRLIGDVFLIKRAWTRYRIRVDWQAFRKYGGGELNNSGAHFIDQLLYLADSPVKRLNCALRKIISKGDAEDVAKIIMETENGIILDLDVNFAAAIPITPFQVFGRYGSVLWEEEKQQWHLRYYDEKELSEINLQNTLAAEGRSYMDDQKIPWQEKIIPVKMYKPISYYDKCYEYFALDKKPFVPVDQSREVMRIIEECRSMAIK